MFSLKDKVAIVTGASQGIGRDTALALAEVGAKVAVAARNEERLAVLVNDINAAGGEAIAVKMDVADFEQVKAGFKQVLEKFGRLDILVNNAAVTRDGLAMRMKQAEVEQQIQAEQSRRGELVRSGSVEPGGIPQRLHLRIVGNIARLTGYVRRSVFLHQFVFVTNNGMSKRIEGF